MLLSDPDYPPPGCSLLSPCLLSCLTGTTTPKRWHLLTTHEFLRYGALRKVVTVASNAGSLLLPALTSNQDRTAMGSMLVEPRARLKGERGVGEHRRNRIQGDGRCGVVLESMRGRQQSSAGRQ